METHLAQWLQGTPEGEEAESILRRCVHCGFCTATCPTYQLLGDELDGPRGRIYLIKEVVEGAAPTRATQQHLDRCLTCRNCETTCPSGVQYGRLVDIGRALVDARVQRPWAQRAQRKLLGWVMNAAWFGLAYRAGQALREWVPSGLRAKILPRHSHFQRWVQAQSPRGFSASLGTAAQPKALAPTTPVEGSAQQRQVLMLNGCVQPAMSPNIDAATRRVLARLGIAVFPEQQSGCCGAVRHHLDDQVGALNQVRRNIDAWWPLLDSVEAIVVNASGCGAMVKEYGHLMRADPQYAAKAARVAAMAKDPIELLAGEQATLRAQIKRTETSNEQINAVAFHPPCTLQHGQQIKGQVEALLTACGARLHPFAESHLCCGSAGTYSVLQADLSQQLRDRKLKNMLQADVSASGPQCILSANIGCVAHLQAGTETPVAHWIEWLDARLGA